DFMCGSTAVRAVRPYVCNNWGLMLPPVKPAPAAPQMVCAEIDVPNLIPDQDEVEVPILTNRAFNDDCFARWNGERWVTNQTPCDTCDFDYLPDHGWVPADRRPVYTSKQVARFKTERYRVSIQAKEQYPAVCVLRPGVGRSYVFIVSPNL